jgi:hypothetical protein
MSEVTPLPPIYIFSLSGQGKLCLLHFSYFSSRAILHLLNAFHSVPIQYRVMFLSYACGICWTTCTS